VSHATVTLQGDELRIGVPGLGTRAQSHLAEAWRACWTATVRSDSDSVLLAAETAAECLARRGHLVEIVGAPEHVRHATCGHVMRFTAWRLLDAICTEPDPGVFVPTRTCPGCGSTVSAATLEPVER